MIRLNENSIKLCCGGNGCPVIEDLGDGRVKITDDDGKEIIVKKEEAKLISPALEHLTPNNPKPSDEQLILG